MLAILDRVRAQATPEDICRNVILPEQRTIEHRDPAQFPQIPIPPNVPPRTVSSNKLPAIEWKLSLDEAIRIALENARVIRVLAGTSVVASGQTIYDAAIANTTIDQAQAPFDPILGWNNTWSRTNTPLGEFVTPGGATATGLSGTTGGFPIGSPASTIFPVIGSNPTNAYLSDVSLSRTNVIGGKWSVDWTENPTRIANPGPFPLNPENPVLP